jgi:hypothetical protein
MFRRRSQLPDEITRGFLDGPNLIGEGAGRPCRILSWLGEVLST